MAAPYSLDLRGRVLSAYDRGMHTKEIVANFSISPSWARRVKQRRREDGETAPRAMGGKRIEKIDPQRLAALVAQQPDATLAELRERLGIECALSAVCAALGRIGLSFKKRRSMRPSRTDRTSRRGVRSGPARRAARRAALTRSG